MNFILSIDLDQNFYSRPTEGANNLDWSCVKEGIYILNTLRENLQDKFNIIIPITWFVRSDHQVLQSFGQIDYWFSEIQNMNLPKTDELALHPHLVTENEGVWEIQKNNVLALEQLEEVLQGTQKYNLSCIRFGDLYTPAQHHLLLQKYNIKVDSSALPGRSDINGLWDYSSLTNHTTKSHNILSVPMSTFKCRTEYDKIENPLRYCNITFREKYFNQIVEQIDRLRPDYPVVIICHPHELLDSIHKHQLVAQDGQSAARLNLEKLIKLSKKFTTFKQCLE